MREKKKYIVLGGVLVAKMLLSPCLNNEFALAEDFVIQTEAKEVRVIPTFPTDTSQNTRNPLDNFTQRTVVPSDGKLNLSIDSPVVVEEFPYSEVTVKSNKAFGIQLAGQVNQRLSKAIYKTQEDLDRRQEKIMEIMSLAGVGLARDLISYDVRRYVVEPSAGKFDFSTVDFLTSVAKKYDIDIIGRLSLHSDLFGSGPVDDIEAYRRYVRSAVSRYSGAPNFGCTLSRPDCYAAGDGQYPDGATDPSHWAANHRISYWETVKEPEPGRRNRIGNDPGLTPQDVKDVFQLSYETIKSVNKEAQVLFAGMGPVVPMGRPGQRRISGDEQSYFKSVLAAGGSQYFDILGVDAYVYDVAETIKDYRAILQQSGSEKPIWVGQTGASDRRNPLPAGGSPRLQSEFMVKVFARAFAAGAEKVIWGEFLDNSIAENRPFHLWDSTALVSTETWELRPAYFTYKLLAAMLKDFSKVEEISGNVVKFSFKDRSPKYLVWPQ